MSREDRETEKKRALERRQQIQDKNKRVGNWDKPTRSDDDVKQKPKRRRYDDEYE